jgi:hypothetical protein
MGVTLQSVEVIRKRTEGLRGRYGTHVAVGVGMETKTTFIVAFTCEMVVDAKWDGLLAGPGLNDGLVVGIVCWIVVVAARDGGEKLRVEDTIDHAGEDKRCEDWAEPGAGEGFQETEEHSGGVLG